MHALKHLSVEALQSGGWRDAWPRAGEGGGAWGCVLAEREACGGGGGRQGGSPRLGCGAEGDIRGRLEVQPCGGPGGEEPGSAQAGSGLIKTHHICLLSPAVEWPARFRSHRSRTAG